MDRENVCLKDEMSCTGCGACIASCPKAAITKKRVGFGAWIPEVNLELCMHCGLCERVCRVQAPSSSRKKLAYIVYNRDKDMREKSASGGAFSALATYVLEHDGSVYGAALRFDAGMAVLEHTRVTHLEALPKLLGSKYVQSDCIEAYREVKKELEDGRTVLFAGCSCQIVGLRGYLGSTDQSTLYTIDLICHGVPGIDLFNDYVGYLQKRYGAEITGLSFRTKKSKRIVYKLTAVFNKKKGA